MRRVRAEERGSTEAEAIALMRDWLEPRAGAGGGRVRLGIGDDAAILARPGSGLVWTVDASLEGVHFDLAWLTLEDVAWRSFHAAVSDIAAMGAVPVAALSALAFPRGTSRASLNLFARGQAAASRACACPVAGGNIARASEWQITTTVLGAASHPLRRDGACVGDELWLLGDVGLAAAGLELLQRGARAATMRRSSSKVCLAAWRRPVALVSAGRVLRTRATAAMDVSDGLRADLPKLASASGVRIEVDADALAGCLDTALVQVAPELGVSALELSLRGGEDYALVATGPSHRRPAKAKLIGRVLRGSGAVLKRGTRVVEALDGGFDHFDCTR